MTCCICNRADSRFGVLCGDCRDALMGPVPITREQIRAAQGTPTEAALIDVWGGVHRLCADTTIGRALDPLLFSIYDSSISRTQARLALTPSGWTIQDLASANGSYVDSVPAKSALPLRSGNIVRMGFLKFYFIEQATALPHALDDIAQTARPGPAVTLDTEQAAELGPREVTFKLSEPSGGGAGVVEIGGIPVHLTLAQYELISRLVARMVAAANEPEAGRGFISSDELASVLSLESQRPDDDNVRQLVRRVRRALQKAGVGDMIESRYGLGYRLSVTPRVL